jgi:hypothetical protein
MYITSEFLNDRLKCDYLDFNTQPASDMLLNCVQDKSRGYDMKCQERYNPSRDLDRVNDNMIIKRGVSEGKGNITEKNSGVEGFTDKIFITDNGPGESSVPFGECPEGYTLNDGLCVQVCHSCKYRDNMRSHQFNEADTCFPHGVYNGITNDGNVKCTCGSNNKFCSGDFVKNMFSANGSFVFGNSIKNSIGNINGVDNLFMIDQL